MLFQKDAPTLSDLKETIDKALEGRPKESDLIEIKKQIGKIQKSLEKSMSRDEVMEIVRHMTDSIDDEPQKPVHKFGKSWKQNEQGVWTSDLDYFQAVRSREKWQKGLTNNAPPLGGGVLTARLSEIWQDLPEEMTRLTGMVPVVEIGADNSSTKSLKINNLAHAIVADGADPVVSGASSEALHSPKTRKSLIKLSTAAIADIPALTPALEELTMQIVQQEMAKSLVAALKNSGGTEVPTGVATGLPSVANTPSTMIRLFVTLGVQHWPNGVILARSDLIRNFLDWSLTSASQRGFADLLGGALGGAGVFQRSFASDLVDQGSTADDISGYAFNPMGTRLFMRRNIQSRLTLDGGTDAYFLAVESRFDFSVLDATSVTLLKTAAS